MFTINWFVAESPSHPFGQSLEKQCETLHGAEALIASLKADKAVIHIQASGQTLDRGLVRNDQTGEWAEQYDNIAIGNYGHRTADQEYRGGDEAYSKFLSNFEV
jgi:hypothetical protein